LIFTKTKIEKTANDKEGTHKEKFTREAVGAKLAFRPSVRKGNRNDRNNRGRGIEEAPNLTTNKPQTDRKKFRSRPKLIKGQGPTQ